MPTLLKASSYYPRYLAWFYGRHPQLRAASYAQQHAALMADGFALSDSWSRHLGGSDGRFAVTELVINAEPMQKQWAAEHGVRYQEANWREEIFLAQFRHFAPRLLYAHAHEVDVRLRAKCRQIANGRLFVMTYDGIGRHSRQISDESDLVLTCLQSSAKFYAEQGANSHWMMFGFEPSILERLPIVTESVELSFVGGLELRIGHQERAKTLAKLAAELPIATWISGIPGDRTMMRQWASFLRHGEWRGFSEFPTAALAARRLRLQNRGELFGIKMFSQLAASRMTLNIHIAAAGEQAANIRLFESTGVGTCLVTDWKPNLPQLFEVDREIVTFRNVEEAREKITFLLTHEAERRAIAERGHKRCLASHNYGDRLRELAARWLNSLA